MIGLTKNQAAAFKIGSWHYSTTIIDRITQPPFPEISVKFIIGIGRNQAHPDLGMVIDKPGAQIFALVCYHIDQITVLVFAFDPGDFFSIDPWMAAAGGSFALWRNIKFSISSQNLRRSFSAVLPLCCPQLLKQAQR